MAIPGYMWITDDQGNAVHGPVDVQGREGSIEVVGFKHQIYIPNDHDTGVLTGTRKHDPLIITKNFCGASPILNKACCSGKTLRQVKISWYQITNEGREKEYFRHVLSNAKVVAVKPHMDNIKDKSKQAYGHMEDIALRYEKIEWTYLDGNITADDQWNVKA